LFIFIVNNFRKRIAKLFLVSILWTGVIVWALYAFGSNVRFTITVDNNMTFSYSNNIIITNIYSNGKRPISTIQASNSAKNALIEVKVPEQKLQFSYPSTFKVSKQDFPGSDIIYHIDFTNKEKKGSTGFIQVWNMPYSLDNFLKNSKENSLSEFLEFNSQKVNVNGLDGFLWEYIVKSPNGNFKGLEVFLQRDSKLYRVSYFIPQSLYTIGDKNTFTEIVNSLKVK
jgi:hypothetical protein